MTVPYKGVLDDVPFAEIFGMITGENRSGVLTLANRETKQITKRIGFKAGRQAYVSGGGENETIGQLLLKWGKIKQHQLEKSLHLQQEKGIKAGEALIHLKIISPKDMADALQHQVEEKILGCFGLTNHIYSFLEAEPPNDKHILFFGIQPEKIIMDGVRTTMNDQLIQARLAPYAKSKFTKVESFDSRKDLLQIPSKGIRIFAAIKNGTTIGEIFAQGGLDPSSTMKIVYALITSVLIVPDSVMEVEQPVYQPPAQEAAPEPQPDAYMPPPEQAPEPQQPSDSPVQAPQEAYSAPVQHASADRPQFGVEGEEAPGEGLAASFEIEGEAAPAETTAQQAAAAQEVAKQSKQAELEKAKSEEEKIVKIKQEIANYEKAMKEGNHFDLLGVERSASAGDIKKAYFKLAKKFHPDTNPDFFKGEFKDKAEAIFTAIGDAYAVLSDQQKRDDYVFSLDNKISKEDLEKAQKMLESDSLFAKGEILFKKGDFRGALDYIQKAVDLNPDEPENYLFLGWCIYKTSKGAAIAEARKTIDKSLKMGLREKKDQAYYYLGMLAKVENLSLAEQEIQFEAALKENPKHPMATSEIRRIKAEKEKGGGASSKDAAKDKKDKDKGGGFFSRFKK